MRASGDRAESAGANSLLYVVRRKSYVSDWAKLRVFQAYTAGSGSLLDALADTAGFVAVAHLVGAMRRYKAASGSRSGNCFCGFMGSSIRYLILLRGRIYGTANNISQQRS